LKTLLDNFELQVLTHNTILEGLEGEGDRREFWYKILLLGDDYNLRSYFPGVAM
jgi:hypothetical protein